VEWEEVVLRFRVVLVSKSRPHSPSHLLQLSAALSTRSSQAVGHYLTKSTTPSFHFLPINDINLNNIYSFENAVHCLILLQLELYTCDVRPEAKEIVEHRSSSMVRCKGYVPISDIYCKCSCLGHLNDDRSLKSYSEKKKP
jgi:hypothetical protein